VYLKKEQSVCREMQQWHDASATNLKGEQRKCGTHVKPSKEINDPTPWNKGAATGAGELNEIEDFGEWSSAAAAIAAG
jgi:hypothetical protein